jgi:predicted RNA binding protein YcfA (HicA-like mRNA interferase family)
VSKRQKRYERILKIPKDYRYEELVKVLEDVGYTLDTGSRGSHAVYRKPNSNTLTIPRTSPVKSYIIKSVLKEISELL